MRKLKRKNDSVDNGSDSNNNNNNNNSNSNDMDVDGVSQGERAKRAILLEDEHTSQRAKRASYN